MLIIWLDSSVLLEFYKAIFIEIIEMTRQLVQKNRRSNSLVTVKLEAVEASHGRTPNEDINQRYLKNWADVADKICFGRT